jgi:hypothetical protein
MSPGAAGDNEPCFWLKAPSGICKHLPLKDQI